MNLYSFAKAFLYPDNIRVDAGVSGGNTTINNSYSNTTKDINITFNFNFSKPKMIKPITKY